ncbi:MAG: metal-dependent hydrolase [Fimbriiglobus sp.]
MAGFRMHITVSTVVGVGYGAVAVNPVGFPTDAAVLAAGLTAVGGMLPDLDSESGRPVRELAGLAGALVPLLMLPRFQQGGASPESVLATMGTFYFLIRYGLSWVLKKSCVHRGMFHSIPAMFIAGLIVYLEYGSPDRGVRVLLAAGVMLGFLSHLVLDEIYSVDLNGVVPRLSKSAGSAVKFVSPSWRGTLICYGILFALAAAAIADHRQNPDANWGVLAKWMGE